ncbi:MAG: hypothetical protein K8R48_02435 [Alphaproteobacteria bacterium]|nr:hypothetical protein [Alphaproteobacteria bacterium]
MTNIISYDQANAQTKAKMDKIIAGMTDSFDAVFDFGMESLQKLAAIASKTLGFQAQFEPLFRLAPKAGEKIRDFNKAASKLQADIHGLIPEVYKLSLKRIKCCREINVYLGAAEEVLKRKIVVKHKKDLTDRIDLLKSMNSQGGNMSHEIQHALRTFKSQFRNLERINTKKNSGGKFTP